MTEMSHAAGWPLVADLPGILPTRQRRSQETTVALLEAGAELLRDYGFDELSIDELCSRVGVTIGAFYGRFESKDAFFAALLSLASKRSLSAIDEAIAKDKHAGADLETVCRDIVAVVTDIIRRNEGVLRASMQYRTEQPGPWTAVVETRIGIVERSMPLLLARMGRDRQAEKRRTVAFAFQILFGTLLHAVLNKPRLVGLHDDEMIDRLALVMFLQLDHEARGGAASRKRRKT